MTMRGLNVAEELLLLSLHDVKGTVHCTASHALPYGIAGALLAELAISGRLRADEKQIIVVDRAATGDALLDEALGLVHDVEIPREPVYWVNMLAGGMPRLNAAC
jgi:hypothetical protein